MTLWSIFALQSTERWYKALGEIDANNTANLEFTIYQSDYGSLDEIIYTIRTAIVSGIDDIETSPTGYKGVKRLYWHNENHLIGVRVNKMTKEKNIPLKIL